LPGQLQDSVLYTDAAINKDGEALHSSSGFLSNNSSFGVSKPVTVKGAIEY
jgi:hypothetical protein